MLLNTVWMQVAQYLVETAILEIRCCDVRNVALNLFLCFMRLVQLLLC